MKKYFLIIILSLVSITATAKSPNLNVEKMFDGSYNSNPNVTIIISQTPEKYFRACTVNDNEALVNKVTQLFEKDLTKAIRSQDFITNGSRFRSFTVKNNNEEIYIGLTYNQNNGCDLFITGSSAAFK